MSIGIIHLVSLSWALILFGAAETVNPSRFEYRVKIKTDPEICQVNIIKTAVKDSSETVHLVIDVLDTDNKPIDFVNVLFKSDLQDTFFLTPQNGRLDVFLPPTLFKLSTYSTGHAAITGYQINLQELSLLQVQLILGKAELTRYAIIRSKRKLKKAELKSIKNALILDEVHPLIQDQTCSISWEI